MKKWYSDHVSEFGKSRFFKVIAEIVFAGRVIEIIVIELCQYILNRKGIPVNGN